MTAHTTGGCPRAPLSAEISTGPGRRRWGRLLFAVVALLVGFTPPATVFAVNPHAASDIGLTAVPVPAWVFVAVWSVIYPAIGVAAWHLWTRTTGSDRCVALAVLGAGFVQTTSFWLTDSLRATAVMDATGVLLAGTTLWVVSWFSSTAARWLVPWLVWMPITLGIKVAVLSGLL